MQERYFGNLVSELLVSTAIFICASYEYVSSVVWLSESFTANNACIALALVGGAQSCRQED